MSTTARRWRLVGLLILAGILAGGCDFPGLAYFLALAPEPKNEAGLMKLASDDGKEVKAIILVYSGLETRPEFVTIDRQLSGLLAHQLQQGCKDNKEKVTIVPSAKVQEFKNNHPDWYTMNLAEIGRRFEADYVIYLDIESMSLYEAGSANTLYRGKAEISVKLADVHKPDEEPICREFHREFPSKMPISADDKNPQEFCQVFLTDVARHLSWYFTAHPVEDDFVRDE
jgi:hypothetical protein